MLNGEAMSEGPASPNPAHMWTSTATLPEPQEMMLVCNQPSLTRYQESGHMVKGPKLTRKGLGFIEVLWLFKPQSSMLNLHRV